MSRKILSIAGLYLLPKSGARASVACSTLASREGFDVDDGTVRVEDVRAVATEAALAAAVDASPAVLVSLWAHDERLHPGHRSPPRRGA